MVFQDPYSSLNPRQTVGNLISEPLKVHGISTGATSSRSGSRSCSTIVGLPPRQTADTRTSSPEASANGSAWPAPLR